MEPTSDELLETFDEHGDPLGLVPRATVHAEGFWHRAAHVWLFDGQGRVYVQRRSAHKDLNADLLDVSVGEHVQPGESFSEAAVRGLGEELGVEAHSLTPVGDVRAVWADWPQSGLHDYELQQAFTAVASGTPEPEPAEVASLYRLSTSELNAWLQQQPEAFTPGFHHDVRDLSLV